MAKKATMHSTYMSECFLKQVSAEVNVARTQYVVLLYLCNNNAFPDF